MGGSKGDAALCEGWDCVSKVGEALGFVKVNEFTDGSGGGISLGGINLINLIYSGLQRGPSVCASSASPALSNLRNQDNTNQK